MNTVLRRMSPLEFIGCPDVLIHSNSTSNYPSMPGYSQSHECPGIMPWKAGLWTTAFLPVSPPIPANGQGSAPTCILRLHAVCRLYLCGGPARNRVIGVLPLQPSLLRYLPYPPYSADIGRKPLCRARCGHHREPVRHGFQNLVLNTGGDRKRRHRHVRLRQIRSAHPGRSPSPPPPRSSAIAGRSGRDSGPRSETARPRPPDESAAAPAARSSITASSFGKVAHVPGENHRRHRPDRPAPPAGRNTPCPRRWEQHVRWCSAQISRTSCASRSVVTTTQEDFCTDLPLILAAEVRPSLR